MYRLRATSISAKQTDVSSSRNRLFRVMSSGQSIRARGRPRTRINKGQHNAVPYEWRVLRSEEPSTTRYGSVDNVRIIPRSRFVPRRREPNRARALKTFIKPFEHPLFDEQSAAGRCQDAACGNRSNRDGACLPASRESNVVFSVARTKKSSTCGGRTIGLHERIRTQAGSSRFPLSRSRRPYANRKVTPRRARSCLAERAQRCRAGVPRLPFPSHPAAGSRFRKSGFWTDGQAAIKQRTGRRNVRSAARVHVRVPPYKPKKNKSMKRAPTPGGG